MGGGQDQGLATLKDWGARREQILADAQRGLAQTLGGNQVYLDFVLGERSEQTMRLVRRPKAALLCLNLNIA